jgi:diguanylate cyclase
MDEVARLRYIIETQRLMNSVSRDRQKLLDAVTERAQTITGADGSMVELVEADEMLLTAASGQAADAVGCRHAITGSLSGRCARLGLPLRGVDTEFDSRVDRRACLAFGIRSMVVVPLLLGDRTVGVLKVISGEPAHFGDADVEVMQEMAAFLTDSLSNAFHGEPIAVDGRRDGLTGLANRNLLVDGLDRACRRADRYGTPLAVFLIDLDGFRTINERFGRTVGDAALRLVARHLTDVVRSNDLLARLGGDEFGLICEDADDQAAQAILERIAVAIGLVAGSSPNFTGLTASVGLAWRDGEHGSPDELLSAADSSMYCSKQARHRLREDELDVAELVPKVPFGQAGRVGEL